MKRWMSFGFDGKDYISLEPDRMRWVAANHFAVQTKEKWDSDQAWNNYWESYLQESYIEYLNKYLQAGKEYFSRKVQPEVFISRREPNGQDKPLTLSCLVTGFDPVDIEVTWLRNGEVMSETQSSGFYRTIMGPIRSRKRLRSMLGMRINTPVKLNTAAWQRPSSISGVHQVGPTQQLPLLMLLFQLLHDSIGQWIPDPQVWILILQERPSQVVFPSRLRNVSSVTVRGIFTDGSSLTLLIFTVFSGSVIDLK
ncbi:patr class I histocompatibility antigen, B-2 alpha chain-like [Chiloscyllium plagiosum]|uniref:patr class I histocompatibility antigen, B-2 alpha chain-like n=1 Tax=Chiloscyllium plagiosum TaxID=36176 RepID=UPI001CB82777|nr:patr class I histocompatibility antigen, B-2 alpha chain-like [Chiloscyllium plagiosum]